MPRSPSPDRRRRSPSPSRGRDRDGDRGRDRSRSPSRKQWSQRRPKELSFYKRGAPSVLPPGAAPLAGEVGEEETAKERAQRRERGEVPRRYGGTREQGVRNTMGNAISAPAASIGSFKRTADPLDRMGVRGEKDSGRDREREREREHRSGDRDRRDRDRGDRDRRDRDRDREHRRDRDRDRERGERRDEPRDTRHPDRAVVSGSADGKGNGPVQIPAPTVRPGRMIEVIANDRMGRKVRIKCLPTDTVGDLKRLIAAQTGTSAQKIVLKKWYTAFKDHVQLQDYEINDGMSLEMY